MALFVLCFKYNFKINLYNKCNNYIEAIRKKLRSASSESPHDKQDDTSPKQLVFTDYEDSSSDLGVTAAENTICSVNCNKSNKKDILCCNSCMVKVHASCIGENSSLTSWTCSKCRKIGDNIIYLVNEMKFTSRTLHDLKLNYLEANNRISQLETELISLRQTNSELVQQVDTTNIQIGILASENKLLKDELIKQKHKIDEPQTSPDNLPQETFTQMTRQSS